MDASCKNFGNVLRASAGTTVALALLATPAAADVLYETAQLLPGDISAGDYFGCDVAAEGRTAVFGAPLDAVGGVAYVFTFEGGTWSEAQTLVGADVAPDDYFGARLAMSGDVAILSSMFDDDGSLVDCGSATVFRFDGSTWVEEQKLLASDRAAVDRFGHSVEIDGDTAIVGAIFNDDRGTDSGAAYIYRFDGTVWQETKLLAYDGQAGDRFGNGVAVSGDVAVVGASHDDDRGANAGSAYVFRFDGSDWVFQQKLFAPGGVGGDYFGGYVAMDGDAALIAAHGADAPGTNSGAVWVFRFDGSTWVAEQKLVASDGAGSDFFGHEVEIDGDVALVGSSYHGHMGSWAGAAWVYRFDGTSWVEQYELLASTGGAEDRFGYGGALTDGQALIGAVWDDVAGSRSGCGYVFDLVPCTADLDGSGAVDTTDLLILLAVWGDCERGCLGADIDEDGTVDVADLLMLLRAWGPCD
jgi:hypothetical protein